ncbi:hypothetical protein [Deefgea piscis]|uniref:hypothetical protein n=1 Tax=Deefgea piscis TaxID=2739061 RepID=UPI001C80AE95|nr:hypothetical protein [Deefgea piscis]QZA81446.1 hypothetical protein K4H25_01900 [Deefgea piscis]
MNCTGCGAALPVDQLVCSYCGLYNAVDLLAIRDFKILAEHSELHCPNGCGDLQLLQLGIKQTTVGHCSSCKGLHFAPGALPIVLDHVAAQVREINHGRIRQIIIQRIKPEVVRYKPCPACNKMLNRRAFSRHIAVIVDECREHGVWLDGGEFSILAEWMEAGGQQYVLAETERQARIDAANGQVDAIRYTADSPKPNEIPQSIDDFFRSPKPNAPFSENVPAWCVGAVLTLLLFFLLGLSWPVYLLALATGLAWHWR